jgi:hypothetical protein
MPNAPKPTSILVNGINGRTGRYGIEPLKIADVARAIRGEPPETAGPKHVLDRGTISRARVGPSCFMPTRTRRCAKRSSRS